MGSDYRGLKFAGEDGSDYRNLKFGGGGGMDMEEERRRKAASIIANNGLSPEQILEANRLQFTRNRAAVKPGQSGYDPRQFAQAGQDTVITGRNPELTNAGVQMTPEQGDLAKTYKDLISSVRASRQSAGQFNYQSDVERMNLDSLTKAYMEYEKNPPISEEGKLQEQAVVERYNRLTGVKPGKMAPPVPGEQMPADPGKDRGFLSNVFRPFTTDQTWWGEKFGGKQAAAGGTKVPDAAEIKRRIEAMKKGK